MLGLEFCLTAAVTENSNATVDRNQADCILEKNIYIFIK